MATCDGVHEQYDRLANSEIHSGELPDWMHVRGRVAWYVFQGGYQGIGQAFPEFVVRAAQQFPGQLAGPPGDVYVCPPDEHRGPKERTLTTIFWLPLRPK